MARTGFQLPASAFPASATALRLDVRAFLADQREAGGFTAGVDTWLGGFDPRFSAELGKRKWLGMTIPVDYGGPGRSALERFVVVEELLAAGAPVAAHWFADRQVGPSIVRFGTDMQRERFLPAIAAGECFFAIGMSEPDAGSDLASVRTKGVKVPGGWEVTGAKIWTSGAHKCHYLLALVRTSAGRHDGLSQFVIPLDSTGISIRPIALMTGARHFNEVVLEAVFVPDEMVLGTVGNGWSQVRAELAFERSGPERFLSTVQLLVELTKYVAESCDDRAAAVLGDLYAQLWSIRHISVRVAGALDAGEAPDTAAALIKDLGTRFEQDSIDAVRHAVGVVAPDSRLDRLLWQATLHSPGFTLRGGTSQVLRILVSRGLEQ
jgi:alkylation response protein AidB-like acyl-CoA dehydrogenase